MWLIYEKKIPYLQLPRGEINIASLCREEAHSYFFRNRSITIETIAQNKFLYDPHHVYDLPTFLETIKCKHSNVYIQCGYNNHPECVDSYLAFNTSGEDTNDDLDQLSGEDISDIVKFLDTVHKKTLYSLYKHVSSSCIVVARNAKDRDNLITSKYSVILRFSPAAHNNDLYYIFGEVRNSELVGKHAIVGTIKAAVIIANLHLFWLYDAADAYPGDLHKLVRSIYTDNGIVKSLPDKNGIDNFIDIQQHPNYSGDVIYIENVCILPRHTGQRLGICLIKLLQKYCAVCFDHIRDGKIFPLVTLWPRPLQPDQYNARYSIQHLVHYFGQHLGFRNIPGCPYIASMVNFKTRAWDSPVTNALPATRTRNTCANFSDLELQLQSRIRGCFKVTGIKSEEIVEYTMDPEIERLIQEEGVDPNQAEVMHVALTVMPSYFPEELLTKLVELGAAVNRPDAEIGNTPLLEYLLSLQETESPAVSLIFRDGLQSLRKTIQFITFNGGVINARAKNIHGQNAAYLAHEAIRCICESFSWISGGIIPEALLSSMHRNAQELF